MSILGFTIIRTDELAKLKASQVVKVPVVGFVGPIRGYGWCNHCNKHYKRLDNHFKEHRLTQCQLCGRGYSHLGTHFKSKHKVGR